MELRRSSTVLGCGCAGLITLFMLGVVAITWTTYRSGEEMSRQARDPEAAAARVREVVAYTSLPAGYRPFGALEVPFVFEIAFFLAPGEAVAAAVTDDGDAGESLDAGFVFVKVRDWLGRGSRTREWLEGGEGDALPVEQEGLEFAPEEVVARGELTSGDAGVVWVARRGDIEIHGERFGGGPRLVVDGEPMVEVGGDGEPARPAGAEGPRPAVLTLMAIECDDGPWERLAVWFAADPAPAEPAGDVEWSGTPADPAAIADFLARLELCG
jgi:hypothetical protein